MKRRRVNKFKLIMTFVFIILFISLGFCLKNILGLLNNKSESEVEVLDSIKGYDYSLNENDSEYFKKVFKDLKKTLEAKKVDENEYAKLVSELFVIDFYSLDNSLSKNDVGGVQFVYKDYQDSFMKFAKDGIYKYVENNIYGDRKQVLPKVTSVEITDIKQDTITFENVTSDEKAYFIDLSITYEEDLGYQSSAKLVLIHSNNKLELAKLD